MWSGKIKRASEIIDYTEILITRIRIINEFLQFAAWDKILAAKQNIKCKIIFKFNLNSWSIRPFKSFVSQIKMSNISRSYVPASVIAYNLVLVTLTNSDFVYNN